MDIVHATSLLDTIHDSRAAAILRMYNAPGFFFFSVTALCRRWRTAVYCIEPVVRAAVSYTLQQGLFSSRPRKSGRKVFVREHAKSATATRRRDARSRWRHGEEPMATFGRFRSRCLRRLGGVPCLYRLVAVRQQHRPRQRLVGVAADRPVLLARGRRRRQERLLAMAYESQHPNERFGAGGNAALLGNDSTTRRRQRRRQCQQRSQFILTPRGLGGLDFGVSGGGTSSSKPRFRMVLYPFYSTVPPSVTPSHLCP